MARTKEEIVTPDLPPGKAIPLFKRQMQKVDDLLTKPSKHPDAKEFRNFNINLITKTFGKPSENLSSYFSGEHPGGIYVGMSNAEWEEVHQNGLRNIKRLFEGFIDQLEVFGGGADPKNLEDTNSDKKILTKKVFIVHGHDSQAKSDLALILTRLGLEPVILHEQPNQGKTLIEKLEKHSDVGYAFVLLTPDDFGSSKEAKNSPSPRARQNVVFEFGMFVGKLTRERVCCLYTGDVELPSDLEGLAYVPFGSSVHETQLNIIKELRAAGYSIDI